MSVIGLVQSHYREVCYMKSVKNLMGDFNFPDVNWHNHAMNEDASSDCTDFFDCVNDCFLSQHALQPTGNNSILDLVLTREPHLVSNVEVMEHLGNSDHDMVTFSVHHEQEILDSTTLFHDYCKGDYQSIRKVG